MNRRDATLLAAVQGINDRLDTAIHGINDRLDRINDRLDRTNERIDRTNERIDMVIDALAELRADLRAHVATHHHDDD